MVIEIENSWHKALEGYLDSPQFTQLTKVVRQDYLDKTKTVYPAPASIFKAFNETPFDKVKVVILGQDPYHNHGQAHGLAFSVPESIPTPPSLLNIFKEIESDIGTKMEPKDMSTDLTRWARQGVFLLNAVLTVLKNQPTSHSKLGWEEFTDHVIKTISDKNEHVVFMLWGNYARSKKTLIDSGKHLILEAAHPSPLSAHRGFFNCRHFSKSNKYLKEHGKNPIKW